MIRLRLARCLAPARIANASTRLLATLAAPRDSWLSSTAQSVARMKTSTPTERNGDSAAGVSSTDTGTETGTDPDTDPGTDTDPDIASTDIGTARSTGTGIAGTAGSKDTADTSSRTHNHSSDTA